MEEPSYATINGTLQGRVAVVTGGAQGIGKAIAELFQNQGAQVCIVDCDRDEGTRTAEELTRARVGSPVLFLAADLARNSDLTKISHEIQACYGRVDILVNNAGIEEERSLDETTPEVWDRVLGVNLRAPFLLIQALLPCFAKEGGAVVNTARS